MRTVPGVDAATFTTAIQQFSNVVGAANVYTSDADLDLYRDAYSVYWGEPEERIAAGAVAPASVEEVQAIVRIANQYKIPLYPISTGRNLGYGGSAPAYSGSVVLDLKRMNRVLEINEKLHYCVVEPGVSFFDLYAALRARGLRVQASQPAPGWGSPIGNALDHGIGTPAGDNFRNSCGMEVVLGNGELIRTGMGALPGAQTWTTYHYGFGPYIDGMFSQSNFGIVTKMGFNLFRWPESQRRLDIRTRNYDDLDGVLEVCEYLESTGAASSGTGVFSPLAWTQTPEVVALASARGGGSTRQWNELSSRSDVDLFQFGLGFSGPDKVTLAQFEFCRDKLAAIPGLKLGGGEPAYAPEDIDKLSDDQAGRFGKPGLQRFWTDTAQFGWSGHLWFSPNFPKTGEALRKAHQVFRDACQDLGVYWGLPDAVGAFPKNLAILKNFEVSKDPEKNRKTREVFLRLVRVAAENGWSEYRAAPAFQDAIMDIFSFNNHSLLRFHEKVKDAIDPNGILSAGRYGIWPKHLRKT